MQQNPVLCNSPSFNSYSSITFGEIADKLSEEISEKVSVADSDSSDDEFEFAVVKPFPDATSSSSSEVLPICADEIFSNGQIRPIYPIFDRKILFSGGDDKPETASTGRSLRLSLRKLMLEDRDNPPSTSSTSSESDELDGIPAGTYCLWTPASAPENSPARCKKSNSTGTSKRWRLKNLMHRSNSDGKEKYVYLTAKKTEVPTVSGISSDRKVKTKGISGDMEMHYVTNRAMKEGDRRRSFLPYRQDIVGFFANVHGVSKSFKNPF
eukprot:TRINITY_DN3766_c0_g2_i1.p1 TRINITY_DN3766_c0_g2~~TRINITY_DN3766_c0_g2_i1.p1  ORF type:complete len:267 (-),score=6.08 TRINITY_DN3766_c0_g2_i1:98-898(-)